VGEGAKRVMTGGAEVIGVRVGKQGTSH